MENQSPHAAAGNVVETRRPCSSCQPGAPEKGSPATQIQSKSFLIKDTSAAANIQVQHRANTLLIQEVPVLKRELKGLVQALQEFEQAVLPTLLALVTCVESIEADEKVRTASGQGCLGLACMSVGREPCNPGESDVLSILQAKEGDTDQASAEGQTQSIIQQQSQGKSRGGNHLVRFIMKLQGVAQDLHDYHVVFVRYEGD